MLGKLALTVEQAWQRPPRALLLLLPLEGLFAGFAGLRRLAYRRAWLASEHPGPRVIVLGNLTVGGSGKTPAVIALVDALSARGFAVAVVSRGYGGAHREVTRVGADSDPAVVGDEALLIARRTGVPVTVGRDRAAAARAAAQAKPDIIISDDGLQHYALKRDLEIVTVDAEAGFGNRHLLPVGPLREPLARLAGIDFVLCRGGRDPRSATRFEPVGFRRLGGDEWRDPTRPGFGPRVHALAAIARPARFFDTLRALGLDPVEHPRPDHAPLDLASIADREAQALVMTEKDAVKLRGVDHPNAWVLEMRTVFPAGFVDALCRRLSPREAAA